MLDVEQIQGLLFSGYAKHPSALYLFYSIQDHVRAKAWLAQMAPLITNGKNEHRPASMNLALTYKGFVKLGLGNDTLSTFARPFIEDMAQPDRARELGDEPETWKWGQPDHRIHILLMLFAKDAALLEKIAAHERDRAQSAGLEELFAIESEALPNNEEHFQFHDGISQPSIAEYRPEKQGANGPGNSIKAGEFILGYENGYGQMTNSPLLRPPDADPGSVLPGGDLGRDGTYLVLRQLAQDVAGFWNGLRQQCASADSAPDVWAEEALGAKMVGRWRDGSALALFPKGPVGAPVPSNDFGYTADPSGLQCPMGAHVRRSNPRDGLLADPTVSSQTVGRHRLLRRGRPYGRPIGDRYHDDGEDRGLIFVTLNANIERQFEFVQAAWTSSPNFAGLYDEADPILGGRTEEPGLFTIPERPVRRRLHGIQSHVTVKGGAYFFLPSIRALRYLGQM